jgi:hypothetical protein
MLMCIFKKFRNLRNWLKMAAKGEKSGERVKEGWVVGVLHWTTISSLVYEPIL